MIGATLGHYKVLEQLGEGGMGVVYKARDLKLERTVAIKVLPAQHTADAARKARFAQEARAASALNHPNIVIIHDIAEENGVDFLVMEYIAGKTLDAVIPRDGLRVDEALRYATQMASALTAAHEAGITHRDIKPGNIMVTDKGAVKVLDFGLAKLREDGAPAPDDATRVNRPKTEQGAILGTVAYMSPEQAEGKAVDARSDIFSFGSVLYEMCTGRRPFTGDTPMSTLSSILRDEPKGVRQLSDGIPPELERVVARCLKKQPSRRFQSTADLEIALDELREESNSGKLLIAPTVQASSPSSKTWIGAAVLLIVAGIGGVLWTRRAPPPQPNAQGPILTQLTFDTGLTTEPSYWPQGNLVAYASDRATDGANLDIWIQQLNGGEARRLTTHEADDRTPDIAPDGSRIVFRSERDGGGLYVVPTIGGAERRIANEGNDPKFSPDGKWIVYWAGDPSVAGFTIGAMSARVMLIPVQGGPPRPAFPELGAYRAVWSPDSKHILFQWMGKKGSPSDWYVWPLAGGEPVRTGLREYFTAAGLEVQFSPMDWTTEGLFASLRKGDGVNIHSVPLTPGFTPSAPPVRITSSGGLETHVNATPSGLMYASVVNNDDIYMLRMDPDTAKVLGEPERVTRNVAPEYAATISHDGKSVGYIAWMGQEFVILRRDLDNRTDTRIGAIPFGQFTGIGSALNSAMSPDGKRFAWTVRTSQQQTDSYIAEIDGTSVKIAAEGQVRSWGGELDRILMTKQDGSYLFDPKTGKMARVFETSGSGIQMSMDGRWLALYRTAEGLVNVMMCPVREDHVTKVAECLPVTDGTHSDVLPTISPNNRIVYFYSTRDGFQCLWAQRVVPEKRGLEGVPFVVKHFHSARISPASVATGRRRIAVARDKIVITMAERTGNIWKADLQNSKQ
ncbi:MAG: protein kinase [Bryobacteraceae bacterium]